MRAAGELAAVGDIVLVGQGGLQVAGVQLEYHRLGVAHAPRYGDL